MKTFTASQLSHKPAEVLAEARIQGAYISRNNTNGEVMEEFILISKDALSRASCSCHYSAFDDMGDLAE